MADGNGLDMGGLKRRWKDFFDEDHRVPLDLNRVVEGQRRVAQEYGLSGHKGATNQSRDPISISITQISIAEEALFILAGVEPNDANIAHTAQMSGDLRTGFETQCIAEGLKDLEPKDRRARLADITGKRKLKRKKPSDALADISGLMTHLEALAAQSGMNQDAISAISVCKTALSEAVAAYNKTGKIEHTNNRNTPFGNAREKLISLSVALRNHPQTDARPTHP